MNHKLTLITLLILFFSINVVLAEKQTMNVVITKPANDFFEKSEAGLDPLLKNNDKFMVTGIINHPNFSILDTNQIAVIDDNGNKITLYIEEQSIYSEFDDDEINSIKIAFLINASKEQSAFILEWGDSVKAENKNVSEIKIFSEHKSLYRNFLLEQPQNTGNSSEYAATLEVIVDNNADVYYLWYLLPMILIFVLLFIRKALAT